MKFRIIGLIILGADAWLVYSFGLKETFSSFGSAVGVVVIALIGFLLLAKGK